MVPVETELLLDGNSMVSVYIVDCDINSILTPKSVVASGTLSRGEACPLLGVNLLIFVFVRNCCLRSSVSLGSSVFQLVTVSMVLALFCICWIWWLTSRLWSRFRVTISFDRFRFAT